MIRRCTVPKATEYKWYGARGIRVCARWCGPKGFDTFLADMGPRPSTAHSLDRKNNAKGYAPRNCRWATLEEQCNNRRDNLLITFGGRRLSIAQWARRLHIRPTVLYDRLRYGWSTRAALTTPLKPPPGRFPSCWCGARHCARRLCNTHWAALKRRGKLAAWISAIGKLDDGLKGSLAGAEISNAQQLRKLYEKLQAMEAE
jgi:hypothetical protein